MRHVDPPFWSSCCGTRAEYIGFYRCASCQARLQLGREPGTVHLVSDPVEAERIRAARDGAP